MPPPAANTLDLKLQAVPPQTALYPSLADATFDIRPRGANLQGLELELYPEVGDYGLCKACVPRVGKHSPYDRCCNGVQLGERAGHIAAMVEQKCVQPLEDARADPAVLAAKQKLDCSPRTMQQLRRSCAR